MTNPQKKISVVVTSYNHERYIAQCLDSVLDQRGDFQLEVVLGDDSSLDGTPRICADYQRRFPEIIVILPSERNLGITKNLERCFQSCTGEYIAVCEGDDYWTDPRKLQKQMAFLEEHGDCSMCFSALMMYLEDEERFVPHDQFTPPSDILTTADLIRWNYIGNFSCCMYRTEVIRKIPPSLYNLYAVDWMFNMVCGQYGGLGFIRERMSVYRKHAGGAWAGRSGVRQADELLRLIDVYDCFFTFQYHSEFAQLKQSIRNDVDRGRRRMESITRRARSRFGRFLHGLLGRGKQKAESLRRSIRGGVGKPRRMEYRLSTKHPDLLILDTVFPHPHSPFRLEEFATYLDAFPGAVALSTGEHLAALQENQPIADIIADFSLRHPSFEGRIAAVSHDSELPAAKLAYLTFLNNVGYFLEALERRCIPFVFTLYPGGGFSLNQRDSDEKLSRVLSSTQFRKVIVTQKLTYDYLMMKSFCPPERVEFLYGVVMPRNLLEWDAPKQHFGFGKEVLDVCFVAHKYMAQGRDKGYDTLIETAKILARGNDRIRFHVVGGYSREDVDLSGLEDRITLYGKRDPEWFDGFYAEQDIILSPNIPFTLAEGTFDGFPTASCTDAGIRKTAMFCTDELNLNIHFTDGEDIVIIPHNGDTIASGIVYYFRRPDQLRSIAERGARKIRSIYSYENQMIPRIHILEEQLADRR